MATLTALPAAAATVVSHSTWHGFWTMLRRQLRANRFSTIVMAVLVAIANAVQIQAYTSAFPDAATRDALLLPFAGDARHRRRAGHHDRRRLPGVGTSGHHTGAVVRPVAGLASQLWGTVRAARLWAAAAFLLRAVADTGTGLGGLRWASPLGWIEELRPPRSLRHASGPGPSTLTATLHWRDRRDVIVCQLPESAKSGR